MPHLILKSVIYTCRVHKMQSFIQNAHERQKLYLHTYTHTNTYDSMAVVKCLIKENKYSS